MLVPTLVVWLATGVIGPQGAPDLQPLPDPDDPASELRLNAAQPDFTLIGLPTMRVPRHKSAFRVTHRFLRPLGSGDFGDLLSDFFGLDAGALIGLELRYGLFRGTQIGIHRTSGKTIQFFGQYDAIQQTADRPFGLAALVTVEGTNNFRDEHSPGYIGFNITRKFYRGPRR